MSEELLEELDMAFYEEAWEYLTTDAIPVAKTVQRMVDKNVSPEAIRQRVLQTAGAHREPIAKRCENAARYLYAMKRQV